MVKIADKIVETPDLSETELPRRRTSLYARPATVAGQPALELDGLVKFLLRDPNRTSALLRNPSPEAIAANLPPGMQVLEFEPNRKLVIGGFMIRPVSGGRFSETGVHKVSFTCQPSGKWNRPEVKPMDSENLGLETLLAGRLFQSWFRKK